jgi:hypothetical protein
MPPSYLVKSVPPQLRASRFTSSASSTAVWSFQRTNIAFGFSSNPGVRASGRPWPSARTGVEPVVSTAMPRTRWATPLPAARSAPTVAASIASR